MLDPKEPLYESLRRRVVSGEFLPGQRLRAEELRIDYGVSASTIREILFRLSTVGLVTFQEQRGFRLTEISPERQHDLAFFRIMLESEGACLSIRYGGVEWEAKLSAAHHMLIHIENRATAASPTDELIALWAAAELVFHHTLISECRSDLLIQTHDVIYHRFRQQLIINDKEFVNVPENIEHHALILEAALQKDEEKVRACIHSHLERNLLYPTPPKLTPNAL